VDNRHSPYPAQLTFVFSLLRFFGLSANLNFVSRRRQLPTFQIFVVVHFGDHNGVHAEHGAQWGLRVPEFKSSHA